MINARELLLVAHQRYRTPVGKHHNLTYSFGKLRLGIWIDWHQKWAAFEIDENDTRNENQIFDDLENQFPETFSSIHIY